MKRAFFLVACACFLATQSPRAALGQEEGISVRLRLIEARTGKGKKEVDPELQDISEELRKLPFKSFVLLRESELSLQPEKEDRTSLPGEKSLLLTYKKLTKDGKIQLKMKVEKLRKDEKEEPEMLLSTTLKLASGATFLSVLQPPEKDAPSTVIAVAARK